MLSWPNVTDIVIHDSNMQDGPVYKWNASVVASHVSKFLLSIAAHVVVTFDEYGVSGHPNHSATFYGVRYWYCNSVNHRYGITQRMS